MPDAVLVSVADAVASALNDPDSGFSQEFEAIRSYADWEDALDDKDSDRLLVDVVPVGILEVELETRGSLIYSPDIDVLVRQRLGPEKRNAGGKFRKEEIDALVYLVQELHEFFCIDRLPDFKDAAWDAEKGTRILAIYKRTHLRQHHQFTGHIRVPFKVSKEINAPQYT